MRPIAVRIHQRTDEASEDGTDGRCAADEDAGEHAVRPGLCDDYCPTPLESRLIRVSSLMSMITNREPMRHTSTHDCVWGSNHS